MASPLAEAHITAQQRLRRLASTAVGEVWTRLGTYNEQDVDRFATVVVPIVAAAQQQSSVLADAYLARALGRPPAGIRPEDVSGAAVRGGVEPREQWRRPFVTVWTALSNGAVYEQAVKNGLERATGMAATDVQLTQRATLQAVQDAAPDSFYGFQRAADAEACEYCQMIDGAYVKNADAMPLHPGCGCTLEPLTSPHRLASRLPDGVAVHAHGELGPTLGSPDHDFTRL